MEGHSGPDDRPESALERPACTPSRCEARFPFLVDIVPQIVWTARPDGQVDCINRRWFELTGLSPDQSYGQDGWRLALHPDEVAPTLERWRASVASGEPYELECRLRRASDGAYRWHLVRALPMRDAEGAIAAWFGTSTDIDDEKRLADELERQAEELARSNAELQQFAYVVSHDLQEPLRTVVSYTQLLERTWGERLDESARECIRHAVEGSRRMQQMIEDLLRYSRIGGELRRGARAEAQRVLGNVLESLRHLLEERGASVSCGPLPEVEIEVEPSELAQVFQNLISNAVKFCERPVPRVRIEAEPRGGEWVFSVRDNGIGIDPSHRERAFQIFQRLHPQRRFPGTGLGLAICRKIVERHGGRIWFDSRAGHGTTFFFTLRSCSTSTDQSREQTVETSAGPPVRGAVPG